MAVMKTDSRSQTARARARLAMADELDRARKREAKLVAVFSAIDARHDVEAALGDALIELRGLGVVQSDLAEMTGLSGREVSSAIRTAKDRSTATDPSDQIDGGGPASEDATQQAPTDDSDSNGDHAH